MNFNVNRYGKDDMGIFSSEHHYCVAGKVVEELVDGLIPRFHRNNGQRMISMSAHIRRSTFNIEN